MDFAAALQRLQGQSQRPGQSPELDPISLSRTTQGYATPEMAKRRDEILAQMLARVQGASQGTQRNAQFLGNTLPGNYEGINEELGRTHGNDLVNELIRLLPQLSGPQLNRLAPLVGQASGMGEQQDRLRMSGGPR